MPITWVCVFVPWEKSKTQRLSSATGTITLYIIAWLKCFITLRSVEMQSCMAPPGDNARTGLALSLNFPSSSAFTLDLWNCLSIRPSRRFQAVSRGSQLICAGIHDRDSRPLPLWNHTHPHHQPTLRRHGLLSPAAQQAQQEPERNQGQQGSHLIIKHTHTHTLKEINKNNCSCAL